MPTSKREPILPCISAEPCVGSVIRESIRKSVVLPAPFLLCHRQTGYYANDFALFDFKGDVSQSPDVVRVQSRESGVGSPESGLYPSPLLPVEKLLPLPSWERGGVRGKKRVNKYKNV